MGQVGAGKTRGVAQTATLAASVVPIADKALTHIDCHIYPPLVRGIARIAR